MDNTKSSSQDECLQLKNNVNRAINDSLNELKSLLADYKRPKLTKYIYQSEIDKYEFAIKVLNKLKNNLLKI